MPLNSRGVRSDPRDGTIANQRNHKENAGGLMCTPNT